MCSVSKILRIWTGIIVSIQGNTIKWRADFTCIGTTKFHILALHGQTIPCAVSTGSISSWAASTGCASPNCQIVFVNIRITAALVTFYIQSYFIEFTHRHAKAFPFFKVFCHRNGSACTLACTYTPVLFECCVTVNWRLIVTCRLIYIIRSAIDCNLSFGRSSRRTPGSPTVYDVILNQRVSGPAIYTKVRISFWLVVTSIINGNVTNLGICFCAVKGFSFAEQRIPNVVPPAAEVSTTV